MVKYKLVYFDIRGIGEPLRLMFHFAGLDFEDVRYNFENYKEYKATTRYGLIPALELNDGRTLYESHVIGQYLAQQFGLNGGDDWEAAKIAEVASYHRGIGEQVKNYFRSFAPIFSFDDKQRDEFKRQAVEALDEALPIYEKIIDESGSGYISPSGVTWIDFFVSESFITIQNLLPKVAAKFPKLGEYVKRLQSHPKLKDYYEMRKFTPI